MRQWKWYARKRVATATIPTNHGVCATATAAGKVTSNIGKGNGADGVPNGGHRKRRTPSKTRCNHALIAALTRSSGPCRGRGVP